MKRTHFLATILIFLGLLLVVDYYVLHILFPLKRAAALEELRQHVSETLKTTPPEEPAAAPPVPAPESAPAPMPSSR